MNIYRLYAALFVSVLSKFAAKVAKKSTICKQVPEKGTAEHSGVSVSPPPGVRVYRM